MGGGFDNNVGADSQTAVLVSNDAADGDPAIRFRFGSTSQFTLGVDDTDDHFKISGGSSLSAPRLTVRGDNGYVGIGTAAPEQRLHVVLSSTPVIIDRTGSDGNLIRFRQDGTQEGSISVSGTTVSYNNFTGSHAAWSKRPLERALLVTLTGDNRRLHGNDQAEIVYGIEATRRANDPAILGAYLGPTEPSKPFSLDNPHLVMASGNGEVWVADTGRDIHPGDYLISSMVPGHAMVDDRAEGVSHIVGRAGEGVTWSEVTKTIDGVKHKKISILFAAFARDNASARHMARLQAENDALKKRLERLEERTAVFAGSISD